MEKIRVLVADDHPTFREGLIRVMAEQDDIEVVGEAANGEEAINLATQLHPNVVIMDVSMPKLNGIEATRSIKEASSGIAVLILSAYGYEPYVVGALEAGASGYMLKEARALELVRAVRSLHDGETVLAPAIAKKVFSRLSNSKDKPKQTSAALHQRELELLKLVAQGMSNKEIASSLSISVRTVQAHLVNIFNKMGVSTRTEAVIRAIKEGWVTVEDLP